MQEEATPPTSACVIEQTFNQLFPLTDARKMAEYNAKPAAPMMMVAIKTGTSTLTDPVVDHGAAPVVEGGAAPVVSAAVPQDTQIK